MLIFWYLVKICTKFEWKPNYCLCVSTFGSQVDLNLRISLRINAAFHDFMFSPLYILVLGHSNPSSPNHTTWVALHLVLECDFWQILKFLNTSKTTIQISPLYHGSRAWTLSIDHLLLAWTIVLWDKGLQEKALYKSVCLSGNSCRTNTTYLLSSQLPFSRCKEEA